MTLGIRNVGTANLQLVAYYVLDSSGHQYANSNWAGPSIGPNAVVVVNMIIDGKSFSFQSHNTYTIRVITSRNTQFTFSATL